MIQEQGIRHNVQKANSLASLTLCLKNRVKEKLPPEYLYTPQRYAHVNIDDNTLQKTCSGDGASHEGSQTQTIPSKSQLKHLEKQVSDPSY